MHILILPSFYPTQRRPSLGIFFRQQALALHKAGHQIGVLVTPRINASLEFFRQTGQVPDLRTATVEETGEFPVYRMHWGWFPRVFPRICALFVKSAGQRAFRRYCAERGNPDIIHAHNIFYSGYLAACLGSQFQIPVVLTEHSSNFLRGRIFLPGQHAVAKETLRRADAAFAVSPVLAKALQRYYPARNIEVLGNIVDMDYFVPPAANPPLLPFVFAAVGNLIPLKGFDLLLEAFAGSFRGQAVMLYLGGDGRQKSGLERLSARLGIQEQVTFLGHLSRAQVRELFQRCHVVVSSSRVETFGVTLIEAMACGRPVVATRSGGPESFVSEQTGLLVPVGDRAALMAALQDIRDNYDSYLPNEIRNSCHARFAESAIVGRLEAVYHKLLSGNHEPA